jgi:tetratricopeptide (TPR) repeat protein
MTVNSSRPPTLARWSVAVAAAALLLAAGMGAWWYGPWNAEARYSRMPLLALHRLADDRPRDGLAWHVLALRLAQDGDAVLAEPALRQAFELNPKDATVATVFAQVLAGTGRSEEAFQILKQAEGRDPSSVPIRMDLGQFYQLKGAFQHAAAEYEAVTAVDKRNAQAWYLLAKCDFNMQKLSQAQESMNRALKLQPNDPAFLMFGASLDSAMGRTEDAIAAATRSATLAPDNLIIQADFAEMLLQRHRSDADLQEGEALIGRMEQIDPAYPPLSALRGDLEAGRGHWDAAARFYQKATEALPDSDHAYFALARAYRRLGRTADASRFDGIFARRQSLRQRINNIHIAIGAQPRSSELYKQLAAAEMQCGHLAEADDALEAAEAISPGDPEVRKQLTKLRKGGAPPPRGQ